MNNFNWLNKTGEIMHQKSHFGPKTGTEKKVKKDSFAVHIQVNAN